MYSNENKNGFSAIELIVRIIFAALFIFIIIWLFDKKTPNMTTFYSSVFRENISYMQQSGENYFTDDKMPKEIGDSVKITLSEMLDKKIILPFVDKDGNKCNEVESYVSIVKEKEDSYTLKTNLVCPKESDYVLKVLGCHNYCNNNCNKCEKEKIISYQYKKQATGTKTSYSCENGYTLNGKNCIKTDLIDSKSAVVKKISTKTLEQDAKLVVSEESSFKKVDTIKTSNKSYKDVIVNNKKTEVSRNVKETKSYTDKITNTTPSTTTTKQVAYTCEKEKTEKKCTTTYETVIYKYNCNCTTHTVNFKDVIVCSTCTGEKSTPVETCTDEVIKYNDTCYKNETITTPGKTTYSCPSGYKEEGSGSNLKCYKTTTTYSCPSGTVKEGSGSNTKCYKTEKTYSCPSGYTSEGKGENTKCYKINYTYSCPKEANVTEGSGSSLKCYVSKSGKYSYECADKSYKLNGTKCYKTVSEESTSLSCSSDYKLEGDKCNKYETTKKSAKANKTTYTYYTYKWSTSTSLSGWTKTGKTKVTEGKEICK